MNSGIVRVEEMTLLTRLLTIQDAVTEQPQSEVRVLFEMDHRFALKKKKKLFQIL